MAANRQRLEELRAKKTQQSQRERLEYLRAQKAGNYDPSITDRVIGGIEGAATMASGMASSAVGGLVGMATAANPFSPEGYGAEVSQKIQEAGTYQPRSETGKAGLQSLANAFEPVEEFKQSLGDETLEATGSSLLATGAHMLPDATMSVFGIKGAQPKQKPSFDKAKRSMLTPERKEIAALIADKSDDASTALYKNKLMQVGDKVENVSVKNPLAKEAVRQGFNKNAIAQMGTFENMDRAKALRMVNIVEAGKKSKRAAQTVRATDVVGDSLLDRFKIVNKANRKAGSELNEIAKKLKGKEVDVTSPVDKFVASLDEVGVKVSEGGIPDFKSSTIRGQRPTIKLVNDVLKYMREELKPDAFGAHKLKQFIDKQVKYGKGQMGGIDNDVAYLMKGLRKDVNKAIGSKFSQYKQANATYSETIEALHALGDLSGKKVDLTGRFAASDLGSLMRTITSNNKSRNLVQDSLIEMDRLAKKHGYKGNDDLLNQIGFADELESAFGTENTASFGGQIARAVNPTASSKQNAVNIAMTAAEKARGLSEQARFKIIRDYLREGL